MNKWNNPSQRRKENKLNYLLSKSKNYDAGMMSALALAFTIALLVWFDFLHPVIGFSLIFIIANGLQLALPKQRRLETEIKKLKGE